MRKRKKEGKKGATVAKESKEVERNTFSPGIVKRKEKAMTTIQIIITVFISFVTHKMIYNN
ncbi:MAG: hypothetical protein KIG42_05065 [Paludibacteraceae bacterium]|nr:hypothetical protein [Paludibacteraceae bacterium]